MGATDFDQSRVKLIVMVIAVVVILHVLTAVTLAMVQTPAPVIEPAKIMPPIEIEMITLTPPIENEDIVIEQIDEEKVEPEPEPVKEVKTQSKAQPVAAAKPKLVEKSKLIDKPKPIVKKIVKPVVKENKPVVTKTKPDVTIQSNNDQQLSIVDKLKAAEITANRLEAQRQQILAAQANAKAVLEAEEQRKAQALTKGAADKVIQDKAAQDRANQDKANAAREAEEKAVRLQAQKDANDKKAEADTIKARAAAAANNEPVSYGAIGNSSWAREPIFTSIRNKDYGFQALEASVSVSMSVDSNGNISNIKVSKSSGNNTFNRDVTRALSNAKLNPATRDNTPTKSTATFTFRMKL